MLLVRIRTGLPHVAEQVNAELLRRIRYNDQTNGPSNGRYLTRTSLQTGERIVTRPGGLNLLVVKGESFRRNGRSSYTCPSERGHMRQDRHKAMINR